MRSIQSRVSALEARQPLNDDALNAEIGAAQYVAKVLIGFVQAKSKSPSDVVESMMRRGIDEAEAKRFAEMGYSAANKEVTAKLHHIFNKEKK